MMWKRKTKEGKVNYWMGGNNKWYEKRRGKKEKKK